MFTSRKLVSAILLLLIPIVSAAALSICPREMPGMNNSQLQTADMGMVSRQSTLAAIATNRCCQVSPAETVPAPPARASGGNGTYSVLTPVTAIVRTLRTTTTRTASDQVRTASSPPQALLCVFLI